MMLSARNHIPRTVFEEKRKRGRLRLAGVVLLMAVSTGPASAANVTINAGNELSTVAATAFGLHTSVYDNQNGNPNLPGQLKQAGVTALRYPGGGYADVYHWSANQLSPWWGTSGDYGYIGPDVDFGHFIQLLSNAEAQAVITIDFGSGMLWNSGHTELNVPGTNASPQEAAAWVAYANASTNIYGTANDVTIGVDALGNNWQTAGYWAMMRAASPLGVNDGYNFLRINHVAPVGIQYWEIGNETFGDAYYATDLGSDGYSVNYSVPYPYSTYSRYGNALLSPAAYGQEVALFSQAMKAVDPGIKIGAVVSTPPGDYSWDSYDNQHWTPQVLAQCATNIDFVIAHWYPYAGTLNNGSGLLPQVGSTIPFMINGATPGQDTGTNSGLRDWINAYRPTDGTNVQIFITEFNYDGSLTNAISGVPILGPVEALFAADCYSTWLSYGVANVDYLEMNQTSFLGDSSPLVEGPVFFSVQMLRHLANVGDAFVGATSDTSNLRAQAVLQRDGNLGILLINENQTSSQTVNVTVTNASLNSTGTVYQFGTANFSGTGQIPVSGPSTNSASGFASSFTVTVPAYTMSVLVIPIHTPPVLAPISNQTVNVGQTVAFTASATDTNQPTPTLAFSLLSGPANATLTQIDNNDANFSWRPWVTDANTTNTITLMVADSYTPSLSATQSFMVTVNPLTLPVVTSATWSNSQFTLQFSGQSGPDYAVQTSTDLLDWSTVLITNSPPMPFQWIDTNSGAIPVQFYRIEVGPPLP
jgi:hypothetical protein